MINKNELKSQLENQYSYQQFMSAEEVRSMLEENNGIDADCIFAMLKAGCVKIEAVISSSENGLDLCYDLYVKDSPDSCEWIYYGNPTDKVQYSCEDLEQEMLSVLDAEVERCGLSYTECSFDIVAGKRVNNGKCDSSIGGEKSCLTLK